MRCDFQHGIDGETPRATWYPALQLIGWCFSPEHGLPPALRVRVRTFRGLRTLEAFDRTERPDVFPSLCGFHFRIPLSFGANIVKLEAQAATGWTLLHRTVVWRYPRFLALPRRRPRQEPAWPRDVPLVTVVIPCHNQGKSAIETLDSVLCQTFSRTEAIIVDYGSDDPTTIESLESVGSAVVLHQPHRNASDARNTGVRRARGKWICCLNPEDRLAPTHLEESLFLLETEGLDLCGIPQDGRKIAPVIYRKELWSRTGGYDSRIAPVTEDREFFLRLAHYGARSKLKRPAGYHNLLPSQSTSGASGPCTILLALPFLTIGGAEASLSRICAHLSRQEFRFVVVTTVAAGPEHGDSTAWFEKSTNEIFHLPQFLNESRWPDFIDYLIESRGIRLLWQVGSTYMYDQLPRIKTRFADLSVLDLLFNPVGHAASFLKYNGFIDHVVVEHPGMEQWLRGKGWPGEKITVIPNGIDLELFPPPGRGPAKQFVVGFFGRFSEEKGPDVFIEIAAQLQDRRDIEFIIAGGGPLAEKIRKSIATRLHNLRFLGFVDPGEFLAACDVLVVCSRLDGRPNSVMEAQAMGVPVIASRVGGLPEMVSENRTGVLVDSEDVPGFVEAILKLSGDRALHQEMRQSARRWAEDRFSLRGGVETYACLLRDLAGTEHRQPHKARSGVEGT